MKNIRRLNLRIDSDLYKESLKKSIFHTTYNSYVNSLILADTLCIVNNLQPKNTVDLHKVDEAEPKKRKLSAIDQFMQKKDEAIKAKIKALESEL